ncbi:hypothetical protein LJC28_04705, partial [Dysgonomonas sp. OttesenSCG-928-D17]|nr:hypothetical protein [Dysgonomonas sp. OttesenSCG-928-D17]
REVRCYISPGGWLRISEYKHFEISSPLFDIDFINKEKETNPEFGNYPTKDNPYAPFEFPLFRMDISPVRFSGMGMTLYYKESDSHIYPVLEVYDETRRTPANPEGRKFLYRYIIGKTKGAETEGVKHFEKCSPLIKTSDGYIELLPDGMLVPYKKN